MPCGAWPSPLRADDVAASSVRLGGLALDGADVYWLESRAAEQGRMALMRKRTGGAAQELLPAPFSVRSRVHEYGGGAFAARDGIVVFCSDDDQQIHYLDAREPTPDRPYPVTALPGLRFADLQVDPRRGCVVCVVEAARPGREPENFLAQVSLATGRVERLAAGADFYAFPRLDGEGKRLAFLSWSHPAMPWDACELWLADLRDDGSLATPERVAGGGGEAIFQPAFSPEGRLHFVSDRSGFANLYRMEGDGTVQAIAPLDADFATPMWVFGLSTYAWLDDKTLACLYQRHGSWHLGRLAGDGGALQTLAPELTELGMLFATHGRAIFMGGSAARPTALYQLDDEGVRLFHDPEVQRIPSALIAHPQAITFASSAEATAHGLYYPPTHPDFEPLAGEKPPLIVTSHGGPTGSASTALNPTLQFWTSRGFAVLDVNYRGSSGYGRDYRKALDGQWGVYDVDDCVAGARALAERGLCDGKRMAIRGSSASGLTVLAALAFHDVFAAGASYYGVCDLVGLAKDTHKFESRYLDTLVGPYPERADLYRARSPLYASDRIACPIIFFQGEQDRVVPPAQAEAMVAALRARGLDAPLLLFADEQHGLRRRENIVAALEAELAFYRKVLDIRAA